ncbi:hypothetical protein ACP275_05G013800 [Erythranthe tilingii]
MANFRFITFLACIVFLAAVVVAHDHHDMAPGPAPMGPHSMPPATPPKPSAGFLCSSPSAVVGLTALVVSFFGQMAKMI